MSSQTVLILQRILNTALSVSATDIHITPGSRPLLRRTEDLEIMPDEDVVTPDFIKEIADITLGEKGEEFLQNKRDAIVIYQYEQNRFKFHFFYEKNLIAISVRPLSVVSIPLEQLNIPQISKDWFQNPMGIICLSGSYGSGRSTVASAFINDINQKKSKRVITLEDPIEIEFTNNKSIIEQRAIGTDVASWQSAIEACLVEDIDLVYISDVKNKEVARGVIRLATSGKLVLAVMTAADSVSAIEQWLSFFEADERSIMVKNFVEHTHGILGVRLVPKIGGGQILAHETLVFSQAAINATEQRNWTMLRSTIATSRGDGMISLDRSLAELAKNKTISEEVALENAIVKEELKRLLGR